VNVAANLLHPAQPMRRTQAQRFCTDTFSTLTHKESPREFRHEFQDNIELEHGADGGAVWTKSKDGKTGSLACYGESAKFSRLFKFAGISYAHLPMPRQTKQIELTVIWETAPNPDPHALLKAVAMLFNRRVPLSTEADLTTRDDKLMCEQPQDP
jgi:hypothetical protein